MLNLCTGSALNTPVSCFANKAGRTAGINSASGLQFPLISWPNERLIVVWWVVEDRELVVARECTDQATQTSDVVLYHHFLLPTAGGYIVILI